ncbi:uncharacterized protein LOC135809003 isoform X2 [Sycon ciliatum]|uniref:uncharacterized protein LOC135809003 isoform X2 n=1 Tax=Sycon ciliatum TaxID=27933 RepID=UPI0031F6258D
MASARRGKPPAVKGERDAPKKIGWTKEEAELSISGVPELHVTTNFDPVDFDIHGFAERLRRSAAAEVAARDKEIAGRQKRDAEDALDNPFVLTMSELQQSSGRHKNPSSAGATSDASRAHIQAGIDDHTSGHHGRHSRRQHGAAELGQQQGLEWDSEYDVILPERIDQPSSQRFRQTQDIPAQGNVASVDDESELTANGADTELGVRLSIAGRAHAPRSNGASADQSSRNGQVGDSPSTELQLRQQQQQQQQQHYRYDPHAVVDRSARQPSQVTPGPKPVVAKPVDQQKIMDVKKSIQTMLYAVGQDQGELWQRSCLRLHWLAETWAPTKDIAHDARCVSNVITFMKNHTLIEKVQSTGCLLVMGLCRNHTNNHMELDSMDGLDQVIEAMRMHHNKNEELAFNGAQCLAVMTVPGRHDEQLRKYVDVVSLVVDCMRVHLSCEVIQSAGCWALANMCCNPGINQEEMKSFGLAAVLHAINQWSSSPMVMKEAIKALSNMYHSDANRENLLNSGALDEVPVALENFPKADDVISTALISIATFAATDDLRNKLCTTKLVNNIIVRMNGLRDSASVQEAGCWALANLVTSKTSPILVQCNVIATVQAVLFRQPLIENLQTMGCMLLYNLACSSLFRLDVVLSGAAKLAVNAIRRLVRNEKVVMAGVKLLAILSHESPPREHSESTNLEEELQLGRLSVIQASGVEALAAAMQVYSADVDIHNMALLAMQNLSDIAASLPFLSLNSVMEGILQSSGSFRLQKPIVDKVMSILENVLVSKEIVDIFIACGGLHIVISLMNQYKNEVFIQTRSAVIMARVASSDVNKDFWKSSPNDAPPTSPLCSTTDAKSLCVAKAGGIWLLKDSMDLWRSNAPLQAAACQALTCIASDEIAADLMVKGDCIASITSAMLGCKEYQLVQERGAAALLALCNTNGFTGRFYRAHGDTAAKEAHKRFPDCDVVIYLAQHIVVE